jgi:hypothetical protein
MTELWHPGLLDYVVICAVLGLLSQIPSLLAWGAKLRQSRLVSDDRFISPTAAHQQDAFDQAADMNRARLERIASASQKRSW